MKKLSMDELLRTTPEKYKTQAKFPIIVILDSVRSMNNVGSIFRTSDAFNIEKLYLCGITATPPNKEIT
ncbi:MAG: TrmH family RNA methyltransferase, partial [Bacteroidales bacterium]|nr:TrmH family RNA methyltransferase [Bacteroidales bacterium]